MAQVSNDHAIYHLAVALKAFDDCNPDVGMGPGYGHFIDQAARELGLSNTDYDFDWVINQMKDKRR